MESVIGDANNTALDPAWSSSALGQVNSEGSDVTTTSHSYSPSNVQSVNVNAPPSVNMSHVFPCSSVVDSSSPAPATPLSQRSDEFSNSHILEPGEIIPHVCVFSQVSSTLDSPHPLPPKKPLTPYMQFSKSIWQQIKSANPSFSVCEVGATIGRLWRELTDVEKQRYNDDFASDKLRYDVELQSYLKLTGLSVSDVAKFRVKRSRSSKAQHHSVVATEVVPAPAGGASSMNEHVCEHMQRRSVLDTTDYTTPVGTDPSSFQNTEAAMDFAQLWGGQEMYGDSQLLAGLAQGQGLFDNQGADGQANAAALMSLQTQQMVENECVQQMAALYSDQGQSSQVGNQCCIGSSGMQDSVMTSLSQAGASEGVWLWQQYADSQYQDGVSQSNGIQTQDGMILYQINSNGEQQQLLGGTDGVALEPGEVLGAGTSVEPCREAMNSSQIYTQMLYASNGASKQGLKLADGEKHMLRSALAERSKEVRRLTKELEQAYGLIHQLKQQNDIYQNHWCQEQQIIAYTQIEGSTLENGTSVV